MSRSDAIAILRDRLDALASPPTTHALSPLPTFALPLVSGAVHEWLGIEGDREWIAPVAALVDLARRVIAHAEAGAVLWIGARAWPHAHALVARDCSGQNHALLERSIFVNPADAAGRLWAIDAALRSSAVAAVIGDGTGFDMSASRRLQLAAESSGRLAVLTRPATELKALSAATTRWLVRRRASPPSPRGVCDVPRPRWTVELVRYKGVHPGNMCDDRRAWTVEWSRDACALVVPAELEDGSREPAAPPIPCGRFIG